MLFLLFGCLPAAERDPTPSARPPSGTITLPPAYTATTEPTLTPTLTPIPTPDLPIDDLASQAAGLLPEFEGDLASLVSATRYAIDLQVEFDPQGERATLRGVARIRFINPLSEPLADVVLMLWPNDAQYRAEMEAGPVWVGELMVEPEPILEGLALRVPLPEPLAAGSVLNLNLPFRIDTSGPIGDATPQRFGITNGVLLAPTFYPLVPRLVDGEWQAEPAPAGGDTTNSEIAFYDVRISAPAEFDIVASGVEIERTTLEDGRQQVRFVSGPMRDFAFALGEFEVRERSVDGVSVRAWVLPKHQDQMGRMLRAAADQVRIMNDLVGPYPYPELDVVDAPGAFGGIEYPGLVFVGTLGTSWLIEPTVHEVAHQWFYGLIGDDQVHEPWLDEAAATYGEVLYYEGVGDSGKATGLLDNFRSWLRDSRNPKKPIGLGVAQYASERDYALYVYLKGALFFDALRNRLGDRVFFDFLRAYYQENRYGFADSDAFQEAAESACACDLEAMFDLWVYEGGEVPLP